jgi:hypothetical protein
MFFIGNRFEKKHLLVSESYCIIALVLFIYVSYTNKICVYQYYHPPSSQCFVTEMFYSIYLFEIYSIVIDYIKGESPSGTLYHNHIWILTFKDVYNILFSNSLTMSVVDEGYSRNALCARRSYKSTVLFRIN